MNDDSHSEAQASSVSEFFTQGLSEAELKAAGKIMLPVSKRNLEGPKTNQKVIFLYFPIL